MSGLESLYDSESHALSCNAMCPFSSLHISLALLLAGGLVWTGMGQADKPLWNRQINWYLQFNKIVQSSERMLGYGSNLIVLQEPVKMIIKRKR